MHSLSTRMLLRVQPEGMPGSAVRGTAVRGRLVAPMEPGNRGAPAAPAGSREPPLNPADPAIHAVTDFTREHPMTVDEERQIDDALRDMIDLGVRALLVVKEQSVVGLITSYDIQGEKPMQFLQSSNYSRHQDVRVGDIMTPWDQLKGVEWRRMHSARVGELLQLFEETQLTHLLVIEIDQGGAASAVRGLISRTRLSRQLGAEPRTG